MKTVIQRLKYALAGPTASAEVLDGQENLAGVRSGLKSRTFSNGLITAAAQGVQLCLNIGSTVVLARLLDPKDFGIVAIVISLVGFFRVFNDMGLSTATIQRAEITRSQISNLFWINLGSGGLITLLFALSSPLVAWFFAEPRLTAVTLVLSVSFLLSASTVQHLALLKRHMQFGKIAVIQVSSLLGAVILAIAMAFAGFSYWSLVAMQLCNPLFTCVMTWLVSRWRPLWPTRGSGTGPLLGFGLRLAVSSLIWSVARGSDTILVGKMFGSAALGFYSRAGALLIRPVDQLMSPIEAVIVPTLSRLLPEPERYRRAVLEIYEVLALGTFFFSGLAFGLSRQFIFVLLGARWQEAVPIFAGFSLLTLYIPVASVVGWLLTSQGRGKDFLHMSVMASVVTTCAFATGLAFGPAGVATCYSLFCLAICLPAAYYIVGRDGPVRAKDLWMRFFTHLPLWAIVAGCTYMVQLALNQWSPIAQLLIAGLAGALAGLAFVFGFGPSRRAALGMRTSILQWRASLAR